ncbi:MAG: hypothetical protein IPK07_26285 [Deltaproteobacteria bacterium]|nr:hypothetical protein [Deltaproteobacteria bacterium]
MIPQDNDAPPTIPALADDRPPTPATHLIWRIGGLLIGATVTVALLGELAKLLVGGDT